MWIIETLHEDEGSCFDGGDDEAIYENFGPDEGNRWMTVDELEQYVTRKGKQGLSAEYYKIKNDPLFGSADTFRWVIVSGWGNSILIIVYI